MIIFNNGSGNQTADLELINFGLYNFNGLKSITSNIENINNSEIEIEYYNLHGMKVSAKQLSPGIYICRQGSKITKILIK